MSGVLAPPQTMPVSLPPGLDVSLVGGGEPAIQHTGATSGVSASHSQLAVSPSCMVNNGFGTMIATPGSMNGSLNGLSMGNTRQRKYNFSHRDKDLLVTLIEKHGDVVESRTGDGVSSEQKNLAWADIQARFNAQNSLHRTVTELKKCYWNLKQKTKKALDAGREAGGTAKIDRVLWRIAKLAPEQFDALFGMKCEVVDPGTDGDVRVSMRPEQLGDQMSDLETSNASRAESPPADSGGDVSPPADLDMFPIATDLCSVELGPAVLQPPPGSAAQHLQHLQEQYRRQAQAAQQQLFQQQSSQAVQQHAAAAAAAAASFAERWCAAMQWTTSQASRPPIAANMPDLQRRLNGHGGSAGGMPAAPLGAGTQLSNGSGAPRPPDADPANSRGVKRPAAASAESCAVEMELRRTEHEFKMRLLQREAEYLEERYQLELQVLQQQNQFWERAMQRARHQGQLTAAAGQRQSEAAASRQSGESEPRKESTESERQRESGGGDDEGDDSAGGDGTGGGGDGDSSVGF